MELTPKILFGNIMHKRLFPKINTFSYGVYYLSLPLSKISPQLENKFFKLNRWGLLSFYNCDHGYRNNDHPEKWVSDILSEYNITKADGEIVLVAMPRVLGYVFNPVSFWYCYDQSQKLRAVICEVNNTFGETHSYVCAHDDQDEITSDDKLYGDKVFHVSPFLSREGSYRFRFSPAAKKISVWIDLFNTEGKKQLLTALNGEFKALTQANVLRAFWKYPLVTFKAIYLIHWQAIKLFIKRIKYIAKPKQLATKVTKTTK